MKKQVDKVIYDVDIDLFRQRLRDRLKQLKWSHAKLADKAGVSVSAIDKWLGGKDDDKKDYLPSLRAVYSISKALGVSIDYFVNADFDCLTVQKQMISDYTGLCDRAISQLHGMYAREYDKKHDKYIQLSTPADIDNLRAVNLILSNPHTVLDYMGTYISLDNNTLQAYVANNDCFTDISPLNDKQGIVLKLAGGADIVIDDTNILTSLMECIKKGLDSFK